MQFYMVKLVKDISVFIVILIAVLFVFQLSGFDIKGRLTSFVVNHNVSKKAVQGNSIPNLSPEVNPFVPNPQPLVAQPVTPKISDVKADYPYWKDLPIPYYFSGECDNTYGMAGRLQEAFNELKTKTNGVVSFYEYRVDKAIKITCNSNLNKDGIYSVGGHGNAFIDPYTNEINYGQVDIYQQDCNLYECNGNKNYPSLEIHEILHALGFDHITGRLSIMNSIGDGQDRQLDQQIIDCLKRIYAKDEKYSCDGITFLK